MDIREQHYEFELLFIQPATKKTNQTNQGRGEKKRNQLTGE
jgi:hypothetical protein